ncbi:MAG TPA: hypothetical protein VKA06_01220 [Spirochaetia bacterium]|nr:hypothetical protein [Spirochaetia bacterium]
MTDETQEVRGAQILAASGDLERVRKVKRYDFKRPDKFSLEQIRTFRIIHETIARGLAATVSTRVGRSAEVEVRVVDQLTYAEFMASVPQASAFAVLGIPPLRGPIMLQVDGTLAQLLADASCGQVGETLSLDAPDRPFTEVDALIIESVIEDFLPSIRDGWRNAIELSPAVGAIETSPRDAMIVPPTEMVILAGLEVTLGDDQAFINLAFPYLTLEPIIHVLSAQYWYSSVRRDATVPTLGARASEVPVECELALPLETIPIASLPSVLAGDPVPLPALDRGTAELRVGSVVVAHLLVHAAGAQNESLSLDVAESRPSRAEAGSDGDTGVVVAKLDPMLHELRSEMRSLRIAVEEIGQDREPVAAIAHGDPVPDARAAYVDAPREVALLVSSERPATVAFLIAPLEPQIAAQVLAALPSELRETTIRSLTTLDSADLALHARILTFLKRRIQTKRDSTIAGGPDAVAQILNHVPRGVEKAVME